MLDFNSIQDALGRLGASVDAAESHGTLCGLLLDNSGMAIWLGHTLDELPEEADVLAGEQLQLLKQLFEDTRQQLNIEDMSFELLLPDDSDDLGARLLSLSDWCQGFLYSIGIIGKDKVSALDQQSQECLSDLLEISKLDHREASSEEAEQQFSELVEHVRMSVLMLNETMNPLMPAPSVQ
jgi:yecA family protein